MPVRYARAIRRAPPLVKADNLGIANARIGVADGVGIGVGLGLGSDGGGGGGAGGPGATPDDAHTQVNP